VQLPRVGAAAAGGGIVVVGWVVRAALAATVALMVMSTAFGAGGGMARAEPERVEEPDYEVVERIGSIEIRSYGPLLAAETDMGGGTGVEGGQFSAFMALANFIFANDRQGPGVAMTAPVAIEPSTAPIAMTAPVAVEPGDEGGDRVMRFFMPSEYTAETLPRPGDDRVRIVTVPARTLAVLRFSGYMRDEAVAARQAELLAALDGSGWRPVGEPGTFGYDAPGTPPEEMRNEVFVAVEPVGEATPEAGA
jgi:hypothetical protein